MSRKGSLMSIAMLTFRNMKYTWNFVTMSRYRQDKRISQIKGEDKLSLEELNERTTF